MGRSRKKMAVTGVDFVESLLDRAREVKRVGGTKEDTAIKLTDTLRYTLNQLRADRQPSPDSGLAICFELFRHRREDLRRKSAFAKFSVKRDQHFDPAEETAGDFAIGFCEAPHPLGIRFLEIELRHVGSIEVNHPSPPRSSETNTPLSVPPESFPRKLAKAGRIFRA